MSEPMTSELADALAAVNAATGKRAYDKGFAEGLQAGIKAQRDYMLNAAKEAAEKQQAEKQQAQPEQPAQPSQVILVDEGGIEIVRDLMDNPDA